MVLVISGRESWKSEIAYNLPGLVWTCPGTISIHITIDGNNKVDKKNKTVDVPLKINFVHPFTPQFDCGIYIYIYIIIIYIYLYLFIFTVY